MLISHETIPPRSSRLRPGAEAQTATRRCPCAAARQSAALPEVSEMQAVRHYTSVAQEFSIDTEFYPLGSCTMKYNPRACNSLAMLPGLLAPSLRAGYAQSGFLPVHVRPAGDAQGRHRMKRVSLVPAAGAQGEFAGVAMIRAYHDARGDARARDHRAGCGARHQPGDRGHVRIQGARDPDAGRRRRRRRGTRRPCSVRRPPASC